MAQEFFLGNIRGPANVLEVKTVEGTKYATVEITGESPHQQISFGIPLPYIGDNNNWFIQNTDLGEKATGPVGKTIAEISGESLWVGEGHGQQVEEINCSPNYYKTNYSGQIVSELKRISVLNELNQFIIGKYCNLITITPSNINTPEDNFYPIQYVFGVDDDVNLRNPIVAFRSTTNNNQWNNWNILNKGGGGGNSQFDLYDIVITSQAEFDRMITTPQWNANNTSLPPQRILLFQDPTKTATQDKLDLWFSKNLVIPDNIVDITALGEVTLYNYNPENPIEYYNIDSIIIQKEGLDKVKLNKVKFNFMGSIGSEHSLLDSNGKLTYDTYSTYSHMLRSSWGKKEYNYITTTGVYYKTVTHLSEGQNTYVESSPVGVICFKNCDIIGNFNSELYAKQNKKANNPKMSSDIAFLFAANEETNVEKMITPQITYFYHSTVNNILIDNLGEHDSGLFGIIKCICLEQCNNCTNIFFATSKFSFIPPDIPTPNDAVTNPKRSYIGQTQLELKHGYATPVAIVSQDITTWYYPKTDCAALIKIENNQEYFFYNGWKKIKNVGETTTSIVEGSTDRTIILKVDGSTYNVQEWDKVTYNSNDFVFVTNKWIKIKQKLENISLTENDLLSIKATGSNWSNIDTEFYCGPLSQFKFEVNSKEKDFILNPDTGLWFYSDESYYVIAFNNCSNIKNFNGYSEIYSDYVPEDMRPIIYSLKAFESFNISNCSPIGITAFSKPIASIPPLDFIGCFNITNSTSYYQLEPGSHTSEVSQWQIDSNTKNYDLKINSGFAFKKLIQSENWYGAEKILLEGENLVSIFTKGSMFKYVDQIYFDRSFEIPFSIKLIDCVDVNISSSSDSVTLPFSGLFFTQQPYWITATIPRTKLKNIQFNLTGNSETVTAIKINNIEDCHIGAASTKVLEPVIIDDSVNAILKNVHVYFSNNIGKIYNYNNVLNSCGSFNSCKNIYSSNGLFTDSKNIFGYLEKKNDGFGSGDTFVTEYKNCDTIIGGKGKFTNCKNLFGCTDENNQPINNITSVDDGQGNLIIS